MSRPQNKENLMSLADQIVWGMNTYGSMFNYETQVGVIAEPVTVSKGNGHVVAVYNSTQDVLVWWVRGNGDTAWFTTVDFQVPFGNVAQVTTLGAGAVTLAITRNFIVLTGDGGGNTLATITGGLTGQVIKILFTDALVTITDTDAVVADTVNLQSSFTSAANVILTLVNNGTKWFEASRTPIGPFPSSGKIYDITHADTNEHSVALPAGYPANTKLIVVQCERIAGTGTFRMRSTSGSDSVVAGTGGWGVWFRATDGLFYYQLGAINDDWNIQAIGYITA